MQVGVCQRTLSSGAGVSTESVLHTQMNTFINPFAAAMFFFCVKKSQIFQILNRGKKISTGPREATASRQTVRLKQLLPFDRVATFFGLVLGRWSWYFITLYTFFFFPVD